MFLDGVMRGLQRWTRRTRTIRFDGLAAPDQFRKILDRERARADRTGKGLSVITFAPRCPEAVGPTLACLVTVLRARLRSTDEIGWFDQEQIGAVLTSTPTAGAWKVADDVCAAFPDETPPPICTVYAYPTDDYPENGRAAADGPGERKPGRPAMALDSLFLRPLPTWKRCLDVVGAAAGLCLPPPCWRPRRPPSS